MRSLSPTKFILIIILIVNPGLGEENKCLLRKAVLGLGSVLEICHEVLIIDRRLVEELKSLAKKEGVSLSKLIARSLEEFLIERKKKEAGRKLKWLAVRNPQEHDTDARSTFVRVSFPVEPDLV